VFIDILHHGLAEAPLSIIFVGAPANKLMNSLDFFLDFEAAERYYSK